MDPIRLARWSTALAVTIAAIALLVGLMLVVISQVPSARHKLRCKSNMMAISAALQRYYWPNETYPDNLDALRKDYLKEPGVLRCPADKSPGRKPSYDYIKPAPNAPGNAIVLSCDRHRGSFGKRIRFTVTKDGEWDVGYAEDALRISPPQKQRRPQSGDAVKPTSPK